jgi:hypothetical protein
MRIARPHADSEIAQGRPQPLRDDRHHAKIDKDHLKGAILAPGDGLAGVKDRAGRLVRVAQGAHKNVAGVGIGVDKVGDKDLFHVNFVEFFGHLGPADARRLQFRQIANFEVADIFQSQGARAAVIPIDFGHVHAGVVGKIAGKTLGVLGLGFEIKLVPGDGGELAGQPVQIDPAADAPVQLEPADGQGDGRQIGLHQHVDAGALHLDHHRLPIEQPGLMHLRQ